MKQKSLRRVKRNALTKQCTWCTLFLDMKIQYCKESLIQSGGGT